MKTYNSKIINFLSNGNTILIRNSKEARSFESLMNKLGLTFFKDKNIYEVERLNKINAERTGEEYDLPYGSVLIEYNNGKGFCCWCSKKESIKWFEQEPFTWKEIKKDIEGGE